MASAGTPAPSARGDVSSGSSMEPGAAAAAQVEIDLLVEGSGWEALPDAEAVAEKAARAALAAAGEVPQPAEMSITLTDDASIRTLNRTWRGFDKPTNVLSFPAADQPEGVLPHLLGDVIVACETLRREAAEEQKAPADHLAHLVVHGTLHLMGFDHETDDEAETMEALERQILAGLGIDDPYGLPKDG